MAFLFNVFESAVKGKQVHLYDINFSINYYF